MNVVDLLDESRVACAVEVTSKKRVLELLSQLLSTSQPQLNQHEIFESFLSRERLGSTGLGYGVAIPHGRVAQLDSAVAAFVQASAPVDFDAVDQQPVDLFFALLVPQDATQEHLQILASLAEMLRDSGLRQHLREATTVESLMRLFRDWAEGGGSSAARSGY